MQKVMSDRQCMEKGLDNVLEAQMERGCILCCIFLYVSYINECKAQIHRRD